MGVPPPSPNHYYYLVLNAHPSLSWISCHDCKSFLKLPPPKAIHAINGIPECTPFPFIEFLSRLHVIFQTSPPKTLHAIAVLNANPSLSKSSCHVCKSFLKLPPPKAIHAINGIPECTPFPFIEFLSRLQVIFQTSPPKTLHAIVVLNANPSLS